VEALSPNEAYSGADADSDDFDQMMSIDPALRVLAADEEEQDRKSSDVGHSTQRRRLSNMRRSSSTVEASPRGGSVSSSRFSQACRKCSHYKKKCGKATEDLTELQKKYRLLSALVDTKQEAEAAAKGAETEAKTELLREQRTSEVLKVKLERSQSDLDHAQKELAKMTSFYQKKCGQILVLNSNANMWRDRDERKDTEISRIKQRALDDKAWIAEKLGVEKRIVAEQKVELARWSTIVKMLLAKNLVNGYTRRKRLCVAFENLTRSFGYILKQNDKYESSDYNTVTTVADLVQEQKRLLSDRGNRRKVTVSQLCESIQTISEQMQHDTVRLMNRVESTEKFLFQRHILAKATFSTEEEGFQKERFQMSGQLTEQQEQLDVLRKDKNDAMQSNAKLTKQIADLRLELLEKHKEAKDRVSLQMWKGISNANELSNSRRPSLLLGNDGGEQLLLHSPKHSLSSPRIALLSPRSPPGQAAGVIHFAPGITVTLDKLGDTPERGSISDVRPVTARQRSRSSSKTGNRPSPKPVTTAVHKAAFSFQVSTPVKKVPTASNGRNSSSKTELPSNVAKKASNKYRSPLQSSRHRPQSASRSRKTNQRKRPTSAYRSRRKTKGGGVDTKTLENRLFQSMESKTMRRAPSEKKSKAGKSKPLPLAADTLMWF
jgi:hypothetical protein